MKPSVRVTMTPGPPPSVSSWPVRLTGMLLLVQAVGLVVYAVYHFAQIDWEAEQLLGSFSRAAWDAIVLSAVHLPLALLALLAFIGFALRLLGGWLLAMIVESVSLLTYLVLYFSSRPQSIYPLMLYSIIMVLYLNSFAVRVAFHANQAGPDGELEGDR